MLSAYLIQCVIVKQVSYRASLILWHFDFFPTCLNTLCVLAKSCKTLIVKSLQLACFGHQGGDTVRRELKAWSAFRGSLVISKVFVIQKFHRRLREPSLDHSTRSTRYALEDGIQRDFKSVLLVGGQSHDFPIIAYCSHMNFKRLTPFILWCIIQVQKNHCKRWTLCHLPELGGGPAKHSLSAGEEKQSDVSERGWGCFNDSEHYRLHRLPTQFVLIFLWHNQTVMSRSGAMMHETLFIPQMLWTGSFGRAQQLVAQFEQASVWQARGAHELPTLKD